MGAVYAARHVSTGARVALKQVLFADDGPEASARFEVEVRALAELRHPHVVRLIEAGRDPLGRPWIAMELVEGEGLERLLRREGRLSPPRALALLRPLVAALAHAHEQGVVHRDLKPSNVLLRARDGAPLLTDFGLAKRLDQSQALTQTGEVLGTPGYLAPEQCGVPGEIGPATDVYGLGALLYALLTGRPPCAGATLIDSLRQVIEVPPRPPSELAEVPPALDALCLRCLAKSPAQRFPDMQALRAALEQAASPARRSSPALLAGAALLAALGLGALAGAASLGPPREAASPDPSPTQPPAAAPTAPASAASSAPLSAQVARALDEGDLTRACEHLRRAAGTPWEERLRATERVIHAARVSGERAWGAPLRALSAALLDEAPPARVSLVFLLQARCAILADPQLRDPGDLEALLTRALAGELSRRQQIQARSLLDRALPQGAASLANALAWVRLEPGPTSCLALGMGLANQGQEGPAVPFLRAGIAALERDAAAAAALVRLVVGCFVIGRFEEAWSILEALSSLLRDDEKIAEHLRLLTQIACSIGYDERALAHLARVEASWSGALARRGVELARAQFALTLPEPDLARGASLLDRRALEQELGPLLEWRRDLEVRRQLVSGSPSDLRQEELPTMQVVIALRELEGGRGEAAARRLLSYPHPLRDLRSFCAEVERRGGSPRELLLGSLKGIRRHRAYFGRAAQAALLYPDERRYRLQAMAACTELVDRAFNHDPADPPSQPRVESWLRIGIHASRPLTESGDVGAGAQLASLLGVWVGLLEREGWRPLLDDLPGIEAASTRVLDLTKGRFPSRLRLPLLELRGCAYAQLGRYEEARRVLQTALDEFPRSARALMIKAELLRHLGRKREEAETLRQILTLPKVPWPDRVQRRLVELSE